MTAFVFEGCDKAGKTTLLAQVAKDTGFKVFTVRRPAENGWDTVKEFRQGKADADEIIEWAKKDGDFLLDRFSYSELVYAKLFKRPCDFPWYRNKMKKNKDVLKVIFVDERPDIIYSRWEKEDLPIDHILHIISEYNNLWESLEFKEGVDFYRFRPSSDNYKNLLSWIAVNGQNYLRSST